MNSQAAIARRSIGFGLPALTAGLCALLTACVRPVAGTAPAEVASKPGAGTVAPLAAMTGHSAPVTVAAAGAGSFTPAAKWAEFHQTVQPFLARYCYDCHNDDNAENGFQLDVIKDAASLAEGNQILEKAVKNLAIHKMPPSDELQPTEAEAKHIVTWMRTYLAGDPNAPINPGRVTARRLNRAEYNNTIRDLLGVDIRPADAFPVDDAGYGFDNNGDVLSLAPMLMEKYLAAAQVAVAAAIHAEPVIPPPVQRWEGTALAGNLPAAPAAAPTTGGGGGAGGGRRAMPTGRVFTASGEIFTEYDVPTDGEYLLRIRGYGTPGSETKQKPQMAFLVDGVQVQKPVTIGEEIRNTSIYAIDPVRLTAGKHRIAVALLNGSTPEEAVALAAAIKPVAPKTEAELAAEEAAAVAAENAAEAAAIAAASGKAARPPGAKGGQGARRPAAAPVGPPKPTMGVLFVELEGPLAPTPDRMPESYRRVMVAQPSATVTKPQAAEKIIRTFATRAYRRPILDTELADLMGFWTRADSDGRAFADSIDVVLQAMLISPSFLFRIEQEPAAGEPSGVHTLNDYELATRLSYFLWSTMPDDELFALAEKGTLRANLAAQVRRMLKDPKSSTLIENFAGQWLQLRAMQNVTPDTKLFPAFDEPLRAAMVQETESFFNAIVQEDRNVLEFLDADFTYVNERLAKHYGLAGVTGENFQRVTLPAGQRGGVITQGSVLTLTSYANRTSPVLRGKWVLENLLDAAPPPPPPNIPPLADSGQALTGTLRQRMEQHRTNPTCASCHEQMDAIGFALENFDAVGSWRTQDETHTAIDASGALPGGRAFNGPAELRRVILAQSDEFLHAFASRMLTYALGRGLETFDRRTTEALVTALKAGDNRFSVLIEQIVRSEPFQKRNGKTKRGDT